ncbi:MAG TPA: protein translocase subunit SecF [Longimicrobium sp.]|jgi:preprotein translocase SecF subunit|uniref:protein translocase subunit SecF n=1 Tax=Longimicrobium sp. TaxID=2029185 RepID=UPI002ED94077
MRIFQNANFPIMQVRRRAYIVTAILFAASLGAMLLNVQQIGSWLNYGVDFRGGTLVHLKFNQPVEIDQIRAAARGAGHAGWEISEFGGPRDVVIRKEFKAEVGRTAAQDVQQALASKFPANSYTVSRTESVGAKVGDELQYRALMAILLSFAVTLIYLAIRFEWRFGVAAIAATGHDILITLGLLAIMRSEVSLGTVAAFLTIVGYSLNDTIVVFDRIRESLAKPRHGMSYMDLLNRAINETLPRTVLTASGTLVTLVSLFLFGGPVIRDFALVLILGIAIGTFSSIFVASPVLYFIEQKWPHQPTKKTQAAPSHSNRPRARTAV